MSHLLIVIGVVVLSFALRSFAQPFLRKLGALGILAASYLAGFLATGSHIVGLACLFSWFLLPWIELLTRVRKMRIPVYKSLQKTPPPNSTRFPMLNSMTEEVEEADFEYVSDSGWDWDEINQFYRIFYRAEDHIQAAICFTEQETVAYAYIALTSRTKEGIVYRTWNFPFSSTMRIAPEVNINRADGSITEMVNSHRKFLAAAGIKQEDLSEDTPEMIPQLMEKETGQQIRHNLDRGLIEIAEKPDTFRYSWRGLFFLYGQLVKDMVKLS